MTHAGEVASASFSPDGKRVVTASWDKTARVWDADTGKPVGEPMTHGKGVRSPRFSPDGKRVATDIAVSRQTRVAGIVEELLSEQHLRRKIVPGHAAVSLDEPHHCA